MLILMILQGGICLLSSSINSQQVQSKRQSTRILRLCQLRSFRFDFDVVLTLFNSASSKNLIRYYRLLTQLETRT